MNTAETILEEIAKDKITEAGETIQQGGEFAQNVILPFAEFIANNVWIIPMLLLGAAIITAVLKRQR